MKQQTVYSDIVEGLRTREFWMTFGMNDVISKYRRSKLGQFWITFSVAVFIFVIGGLYRGAFGGGTENYFAYMAIGYILWQYLSAIVNTSGSVFSGSKAFMMQRRMPFSVFALRFVYREVLVFMHHVILLPIIFIYLKLWPGFANIGLSLLGFAFVVFTSFWVALFIGILSLRYRDLPPIIQSLMRMAFFATPIIWIERTTGRFGEIVTQINPFNYYLRIVRDPLLGKSVSFLDWSLAGLITIAVIVITWFLFAKTKEKLTYWL